MGTSYRKKFVFGFLLLLQLWLEVTSLTAKMTNKWTCREAYDHCYSGTVTGDRGVRSLNLSPSRMNDTEFARSRCFCDDDCPIYGDCCPDVMLPLIDLVRRHYDRDKQSKQFAFENPRWKCQRFMLHSNKKRTHNGVYMESECPLRWKDKTVENLCLRQVPTSLYDYTLDVPVVSNGTNITYTNVYCAICNNDTVLTPWSISVHCPYNYKDCISNMSDWEYIPRSFHWRHINDSHPIFMTFEVDVELSAYYETYGARQCKETVVDYCPSNWTGIKEVQLCSMYSLLVMNRLNHQIYKNKYCAICNGMSTDAHLSCPPITDIIPTYMSGPVASHPYSILIDFMGNSDNVGMAAACGSRSRCGYGEICDALQSRCRPYSCGRQLQMNEQGQCVDQLNDGQRSDSDPSNFTLSALGNCPRVALYDNEFVFANDDSIYVNETGAIYDASAYELVNDSVVFVCANLKANSGWKFSSVQTTLSTVCVSISLVCLAIHILTNAIVSQLRNLPGKNLLSLSCSLFAGQFLFFFGLDLREHSSIHVCVSVAILIHASFLSSFFWMNVMAIDIWRTFANKSHLPCSNSSTKTYCKYSIYAWITPIAIVSLAFANESTSFLPGYEPFYARPICWINNRSALLLFFAIPLAVLIVQNFVLFSLTVAGIRRTAKTTKVARMESSGAQSGISSDKKRFVLYTKLAVIMGLSWAFGFMASVAKVEFLWHLFIVFNALQGAFIFFAFTFKRKILHLVKQSFSGTTSKTVHTSKTDSSNKTQATAVKSNVTVSHISTTTARDV